MNATKTIALAGLAVGLALPAYAGQSVTLHFDVDGDPLTSSGVVQTDTLTWTVYASFSGFDDSGAYFGGFRGSFDPIVSDADASSYTQVSNLTNLMSTSATEPAANGGSVDNINILNSALLGTNDPTNPIAIFSFDMVLTGSRSLGPDESAFLTYTADGIASMFPDSSPLSNFIEFTGFTVISDSVLVPGPAVCVLLAGGLITRRKRTRSPRH